MNKVGLIVPTLNAGVLWHSWLQALGRQSRQPDRLLLIDSSSNDDTVKLAKEFGFELKVIPRSAFNHGGTRQLGVDAMADMDVIVFLTQDALLADSDAIANLVLAFEDPGVAAAYGRQLPHTNAGPIGSHARFFNYPADSQLRGLADKHRFGIKTVFISNSFAAYRRDALTGAGGFPVHTIMNEDTYVAGKLLLAGWRLAYRADAAVFHSHDYGFIDEFKRYFDIGVFHAKTAWLQQTFGHASGEGLRFIVSEARYLIKSAPWLIGSAALRTVLKWSGYKLGMSHRLMPSAFACRLSLHKAYW